jgi:hypothetical protein
VVKAVTDEHKEMVDNDKMEEEQLEKVDLVDKEKIEIMIALPRRLLGDFLV